MFFYIDESGQTGNNLFDVSQPFLYYGVVSSKQNIDMLAGKNILKMRKRLGVDRLHSSCIGGESLSEIAPDVESLRKKLGIKLDMHCIEKRFYAVMCFFDKVFDQANNPAVPWSSYYTQTRYILLVKIYGIFTDALIEKAWRAYITTKTCEAEKLLIEVCLDLSGRIFLVHDERSREIINDALLWASGNPDKLGYVAIDKKRVLQRSPNLVGFQSVLHGISLRLEASKRKPKKIVVDRQGQFNNAQEWISDIYSAARKDYGPIGPGLPVIDLRNMPDISIECVSGHKSFGLEIVDIYLWIFKRIIEKKELSSGLRVLSKQLNKSRLHEISFSATVMKAEQWIQSLPDANAESWERLKEFRCLEDEVRKPYISR